MEETVYATLVINLNVTCLYCGNDFDLFETEANDEGFLYRQVIDDERLKIDAEDRLHCHTYCPECSGEFEVEGVLW